MLTMPDTDSSFWIKKLGLLPHPEGEYYREIFRSLEKVSRDGSVELRNAATSIYYLLEDNDFSAFHRIASDELWYFHKGNPLLIHQIDLNGVLVTHELSDQAEGNLSVVIQKDSWFASEIKSKIGFTLVSCAVAPGFEFSEFELATPELTYTYPQHASLIKRLIRS